jgi:hypothetical protein
LVNGGLVYSKSMSAPNIDYIGKWLTIFDNQWGSE